MKKEIEDGESQEEALDLVLEGSAEWSFGGVWHALLTIFLIGGIAPGLLASENLVGRYPALIPAVVVGGFLSCCFNLAPAFLWVIGERPYIVVDDEKILIQSIQWNWFLPMVDRVEIPWRDLEDVFSGDGEFGFEDRNRVFRDEVILVLSNGDRLSLPGPQFKGNAVEIVHQMRKAAPKKLSDKGVEKSGNRISRVG